MAIYGKASRTRMGFWQAMVGSATAREKDDDRAGRSAAGTFSETERRRIAFGAAGRCRAVGKSNRKCRLSVCDLRPDLRLDWDTGAENRDDQLITLHVWSKAHGEAETLAIMDAIKARLADAALVIGPRGQTRLSLEFTEARYDEDLLVHHGLLRFRALTQESA